MKCLSCGAAKLVHGTRDVPYTCKGESTILPKVTGDFCLARDEYILDVSESRRTMELMSAFSKQGNAFLSIRTSLPTCARSSTSTSARPARSSAVA